MTISTTASDPRVQSVHITEAALTVILCDGRAISAPLSWFPRLAAAKPEERNIWEPAAAGHGIHWPLIDEDLSIEGLLRA